MFSRCNAPVVARRSHVFLTSCVRSNNLPKRSIQQQRFSTSKAYPSSSSSHQISERPLLSGVTDELDRIAPKFDVDGEDIEILQEPSDFFAALKTKITNAKTRIFLSTLYIGKTEHELISIIQAALSKNPNLQVSFLTDALRGTRETPSASCASLLAPLIKEFGPERVQIRMYHTPNLTGLRKRWIPRRINEGWGLQHMKLYGVDDEIIMSGANLSTDYFTNRQDRYHIFRSKPLTEYYARIHHAVSSISFDIQPSDEESGYSMTWPTMNNGPSPLEDPNGYRRNATKLLSPLVKPLTSSPSSSTSISSDLTATTTAAAVAKPSPPSQTQIYPIFQFTPLFATPNDTQSTELPALTHLLLSLRAAPFSPSTWTFTAGYFNTTSHLRDLLLTTSPRSATVIAAAPQANGFYGSKGISGMLPDAYTLLERRFLEAARQRGMQDVLRMKEWRRGTVGEEGGWTYHAKGIWVTLPPSPGNGSGKPGGQAENTSTTEVAGPSITLVGSSNYTARSYSLDLEANALIVTTDTSLQKRLAAEERWLQDPKWTRVVGREEFDKEERKVGWKVRLAMWIVGVVGGAL